MMVSFSVYTVSNRITLLKCEDFPFIFLFTITSSCSILISWHLKKSLILKPRQLIWLNSPPSILHEEYYIVYVSSVFTVSVMVLYPPSWTLCMDIFTCHWYLWIDYLLGQYGAILNFSPQQHHVASFWENTVALLLSSLVLFRAFSQERLSILFS